MERYVNLKWNFKPDQLSQTVDNAACQGTISPEILKRAM